VFAFASLQYPTNNTWYHIQMVALCSEVWPVGTFPDRLPDGWFSLVVIISCTTDLVLPGFISLLFSVCFFYCYYFFMFLFPLVVLNSNVYFFQYIFSVKCRTMTMFIQYHIILLYHVNEIWNYKCRIFIYNIYFQNGGGRLQASLGRQIPLCRPCFFGRTVFETPNTYVGRI
jgi:hypothetical protein